ncbi:DMT family transporter [Candidatus Bandiella euplotis]|uniref:S-adenosylmethionine uptake transporter n=1 Tax=Candidatus Bandiella euplotis TaxID=1664265 RepID=A0ABZ0UIW1_9RICK|nr:DMT family transporter [Candidatus Bandiella woodruffii]WPX96025.1 DMT family transporter [Candidatus Bandiella woodruffii]
MILNSVSLAIVYILMKKLGVGLNSSQVVFFYKICCFLIILPWVFSDGLSILKTPQLKLHILRGFFSAAGSLFFMYSLQHVKLANATALSYLEQVLWAVIAMIFFKEKFSILKITAVVVSFLGAAAVIYPGLIQFIPPFVNIQVITTSDYNPYYTFTMLAVLSWTANSVSVKVLGRTAKNKTQAFYALLFSSIFAFPVAFVDWQYVDFVFSVPMPQGVVPFYNIEFKPIYAAYFAVITLCYVIHSVAFFKAMQKANMSALAPYHYMKIVFVGILGYLLFNEAPDSTVYMGYALIILAGIFLMKYEHAIQKDKQK